MNECDENMDVIQKDDEIWKQYKDSHFEFSNKGNVRVMDHYRNYKSIKMIFEKGHEKKILINKNGYCLVSIGRKKYLVHRIIAELFIPNPFNYPQVNHKDENKLNNSVENLEWCDQKYNNNYGTHNKRVSETKSKKVYQINEFNNIIAVYNSAKIASEKTGIVQSAITHVCNGRNTNAGGYYWSYEDGGRKIELTDDVKKKEKKKKLLILKRECAHCGNISEIHGRNLCSVCYRILFKSGNLNQYPKVWSK